MGDGYNTADDWMAASAAASMATDGGSQTSAATATTNAIQGMSPSTGGAGSWSDFFMGAAKTAVNYAIKKDAVQSGVATPAGMQPGMPNGTAPSGFTLSPSELMMGVVAVVALIALRK